MWEELGFYEGFALLWQAILAERGANDDRTAHHIRHLLQLIAQFPRVNPSATESSDLDIPRLFRQIRSRYKALCASLSVRPTLRAGGSSTSPEETDYGDNQEIRQSDGSRSVWHVRAADNQPNEAQLSF